MNLYWSRKVYKFYHWLRTYRYIYYSRQSHIAWLSEEERRQGSVSLLAQWTHQQRSFFSGSLWREQLLQSDKRLQFCNFFFFPWFYLSNRVGCLFYIRIVIKFINNFYFILQYQSIKWHVETLKVVSADY